MCVCTSCQHEKCLFVPWLLFIVVLYGQCIRLRVLCVQSVSFSVAIRAIWSPLSTFQGRAVKGGRYWLWWQQLNCSHHCVSLNWGTHELHRGRPTMTMMMVLLHIYKNVVMAVTLSDCHLDIVEQNIRNFVNHSRLYQPYFFVAETVLIEYWRWGWEDGFWSLLEKVGVYNLCLLHFT